MVTFFLAIFKPIFFFFHSLVDFNLILLIDNNVHDHDHVLDCDCGKKYFGKSYVDYSFTISWVDFFHSLDRFTGPDHSFALFLISPRIVNIYIITLLFVVHRVRWIFYEAEGPLNFNSHRFRSVLTDFRFTIRYFSYFHRFFKLTAVIPTTKRVTAK